MVLQYSDKSVVSSNQQFYLPKRQVLCRLFFKLHARSKKISEQANLRASSRCSLAAGRQRRDCSQARTSEMLNEFAIDCL